MLDFLNIFKRNKKVYKGVGPCVLVVLDGYGIAPPSSGNAITLAKKPNLDMLTSSYPSSSLIASGESVGLPANEVGNSEVGHLTIGAGRVVLQDLERINKAISDGDFYDNKSLLQLSSHLVTNSSPETRGSSGQAKLHIMGLVSTGKVHSSIDHLYALLEFVKRRELKNVFLHLFTDGRDAAPNAGIEVITKLTDYLKVNQVAKIATISGRYYAMDRDRRWERTEAAYNAMVLGKGKQASDPLVAVKSYYDNAITDEFIEPTVIMSGASPTATIDDGDGIFFFNFRADRAIQLSLAFSMKNFESLKSFEMSHQQGFARTKEKEQSKFSQTFNRQKVPQNLFFVTMRSYHKDIPASAVAFGPINVVNSLPEVLSAKGFKQAHIAESEKEKMVGYYFDGLREDKYFGEDVYIIASQRVATYDKHPEMSAKKITQEFTKQLLKGQYHFFVINFANPDMVAHSGNLQATIRGVEVVDECIGELYKNIMKQNGTLIITADHGNAEEMQSFKNSSFFYTSQTGSINTEHSNNPVPLIIANNSLRGRKLLSGSLGDVAPTILAIMNVVKPPEMIGKNLFEPEGQRVG